MLYSLALLIVSTVWAGAPTPDNVDLMLVPRPANPTLGAFEPVTITQPGQTCDDPGVTCTYRVNIAGPEYVDTQGNTWEACNATASAPCQYVTWVPEGAGFFCKLLEIANTLDDPLYQCNGMSADGNGTPEFELAFNVPAGDYRLTLLFNEDFHESADQREFNIVVEGTQVETNYDIFTEAGGKSVALDRIQDVAVTDGQLNVSLVPILNVGRPLLAGVSVQSLQDVAPIGAFVPYGLNSILPEPDHVRPVLLPANDERTRAGYTTIAVPSTCDYTFNVGDDETTVEAALNNTSNGPTFCVPLAADWRAFADVDLARDCSVNGDANGRCWIVPDDIATRTRTSRLEGAPIVGHFEIANGAHGWSFVGLNWVGDTDVATSPFVYTPAGSLANDIVIAYSSMREHCTGAADCSAIEIRGDRWVVYANTIFDSAIGATATTNGVTQFDGKDTYVHRNSFWDNAGDSVRADLIATAANFFVVNNHIELTNKLRVGAGGTTPTGNSADPYVCAENAIDLGAGGDETVSEGFVYGNIIHGWRPGEGACAGAPGDNSAIVLQQNADSYNIFFNAIFDTHYAIGGEVDGTGTDGSTLSGNVIEISPICDGVSNCVNRGLGTANYGGDPQIFAYNTVSCTARHSGDIGLPSVWEGSTVAADLRYNIWINCGGPDGTDSFAKSWVNVYANNAVTSIETPALDDSSTWLAGNYTWFSIYSEICTHLANPESCRVKTFGAFVPPVGGAVDTSPLFSNPTFTANRGTSTPAKRKWGEF